MRKVIEVVEEMPQHWRAFVPVEDAEIHVRISPEGLVVDHVDKQGVTEVFWYTWQDLEDQT